MTTAMRILLSLAFGILASLSGGWALSTTWNWFAAPLFGISLTFASAIGLMIVYSGLCAAGRAHLIWELAKCEKRSDAEKISKHDWLREAAMAVVAYPLIVLVGWAWKVVLGI